MRWNEKNRTATPGPAPGSEVTLLPLTARSSLTASLPGQGVGSPCGTGRCARPGTIRTSERRQERPLRQVFRPPVLVSLAVAALFVAGIAVAGSALRDETTAKRAQPPTTTAPAPTTTTAPAPTTTTVPPTTIIQPPWAALPPVPGGVVGPGPQGPEVQASEQPNANIQ